ncbi:MAG: DMT family transporter [Proteobacteria bacterium]|nr:DMT family transporter [Pseudomonadota bacterium]
MILSASRLKNVGANALLILTTFFWGVTFVVVKDAINRVDVFVFLAQRFTLAFIILIVACPFAKRRLTRYTLSRGLLLGLMLFGGFALQTLALLHTSASNTAFLTGLNVVFVPLLSSLVFKQKIVFTLKAGVVFAFTGLYLLCAKQGWALNGGDILGLLCAMFIAIHIIYTGRYVGACDIYWLTTLQIGMIAFLSILFALGTGQKVFVFHREILTALIICVIFATVFAYLVQTTMQQYISPSNTALIFCMEPVFAALCAFVISGEHLGIRGLIGAAFILFGMGLSQVTFPEKS